MTKYIGRDHPEIRSFCGMEIGVYAQISEAQTYFLPDSVLRKTLNTSDRGGIARLAKRWHNWWAPASYMQAHPRSTPNMRQRAADALSKKETSR